MEGYDFDMAGEDFSDYKCPICLMLLRHAVILPCSHSACKTCLEKWEEQRDSGVFLCPSCQCVYEREKVYERKEGRFIDRFVTTSLKVKCRHHLMGCDWVGTISDHEIHEKTCTYVLVDCEFKQCDVKVCRKDLDIHREKCSYRPIECGFCAEMIPYVQLEVPTHVTNDCQYLEVSCPFEEMGCTQKVLRRDVDDHVNNSIQQHTNVLLHFTLKLAKEVKGLKEANTELRIEMEQFKESSSLRISELEEKLEPKENEIDAVNRKVDDIKNQFHLETDKISEHVKLLSDKISELEGTVHKNENKRKDDISLIKKEIENSQAATNVKFAAAISLSSEDCSKQWTFNELWALIESNENERFAAIINLKPELAVLSYEFKISLLHYACRFNNLSCIDVLLKNGCSINHENNFGSKPIHWAASFGSVDAAKKLLAIDVTLVNSVNKNNRTLLHFAAGNKREELVKYILTQPGIEVNLKDTDNDMADAGTTKKIRQMIREYRNKHTLSSEDRSKKWTFGELVELIKTKENERFAAIINLKPEFAVLNDSFGSSLLHSACSNNNPSCIDVMLKHGCPINHEDIWGRKPIHLAAFCGSGDAAKKLLSIDTTLVNSVSSINRRTPLHCAAVNKLEEFVKYILTQPGIQVNLKDSYNNMADEVAYTTEQIRQMIREHRHKYV